VEAISSIHNLRMHHNVATRDPLNMNKINISDDWSAFLFHIPQVLVSNLDLQTDYPHSSLRFSLSSSGSPVKVYAVYFNCFQPLNKTRINLDK
jgi:hypothetical protein